jgi:hypothetical protein
MFYVYRHIRLDTNTPFYVGKGSKNRAWTTYSRNKYWHNIVNKFGYSIEIIKENLEENEALTWEINLISLYKQFGYCETNLTVGGEGTSGYRHSAETKQLLRELTIGTKQSSMSNKKRSDALQGRYISQLHRSKISLALRGKKKNYKTTMPYCRNHEIAAYKDGIFVNSWKSIRSCAKDLNLTHPNILLRLQRKITTPYNGYTFEYYKL